MNRIGIDTPGPAARSCRRGLGRVCKERDKGNCLARGAFEAFKRVEREPIDRSARPSGRIRGNTALMVSWEGSWEAQRAQISRCREQGRSWPDTVQVREGTSKMGNSERDKGISSYKEDNARNSQRAQFTPQRHRNHVVPAPSALGSSGVYFGRRVTGSSIKWISDRLIKYRMFFTHNRHGLFELNPTTDWVTIYSELGEQRDI